MEKLIQQKKEFTIFGGCSRNDMAAYFYESAFSKLKKTGDSGLSTSLSDIYIT